MRVTSRIKCKMQAQKLLNTWRSAVSCWIYIGLPRRWNVCTAASGNVLNNFVVVFLIIPNPESM